MMPSNDPTNLTHQHLLKATKAAMRKPPRIVSAFLDAGLTNDVTGGGTAKPVGGAAAGGSANGWWSNGIYLMFKQDAVACRRYGTLTLEVKDDFFLLIKDSGLVAGLEPLAVATID